MRGTDGAALVASGWDAALATILDNFTAQRITDLYRSYGFLDAEVLGHELVFSDDGKDLDLFITVDEGTQYQVGDVTWGGNELFPDASISTSSPASR